MRKVSDVTYISPSRCHDNYNSPAAVFEDSPALEHMGLAPDTLIDAKDAAIYWDYPLEYREDVTPHGWARVVRNVTVAYRPISLFGERRPDALSWCHPLRAMHDRVFGATSSQTFREKGGNHSPTWLDASEYNRNEPPQVGFHPFSDWQFFCWRGFADIDETHRALSQFAQILECDWARDGSQDSTEANVGPWPDDIITWTEIGKWRPKTRGILK